MLTDMMLVTATYNPNGAVTIQDIPSEQQTSNISGNVTTVISINLMQVWQLVPIL